MKKHQAILLIVGLVGGMAAFLFVDDAGSQTERNDVALVKSYELTKAVDVNFEKTFALAVDGNIDIEHPLFADGPDTDCVQSTVIREFGEARGPPVISFLIS